MKTLNLKIKPNETPWDWHKRTEKIIEEYLSYLSKSNPAQGDSMSLEKILNILK